MVPPGNQVTMMWETLQSGTGPLKPMYEMLLGRSGLTGEFTNEMLAEKWSMEPDGKTFTFQLKKGILFHSTDTWTGTEFTSKDVLPTVATLVREDAIATSSVWTTVGAQKPENLVIHDDYNFTWHLDVPEPLFLGRLDETWVAGILSKDYMDAVGMDGYRKDPIGTGPFQYVERELDSHILYERVKDHWRKDPGFDEVQFLFVREESTRFAMLLTDEVHISTLPGLLITQAEQKGYSIAIGTLPGFYLYIWIGGLYYDQAQVI